MSLTTDDNWHLSHHSCLHILSRLVSCHVWFCLVILLRLQYFIRIYVHNTPEHTHTNTYILEDRHIDISAVYAQSINARGHYEVQVEVSFVINREMNTNIVKLHLPLNLHCLVVGSFTYISRAV
jgi:hypothetical protein